jgi:streptogramin lyase
VLLLGASASAAVSEFPIHSAPDLAITDYFKEMHLMVKCISRLAVLSVVVMVAALVSVTNAWAGSVTEFPLSAEPREITTGPDGDLWFTEAIANRPAQRIAKITTSGAVTEYGAGLSGPPGGITAGPDGNVWFTGQGNIAKITPGGSVTEYNVHTSTSEPMGRLTSGPDGNVWFTGTEKQCTRTGTPAGPPPPPPLPPPPSGPPAVTATVTEYCGQHRQIGKITPAGAVTDYTGPEVYPGSITAGPDGNLWFTQGSGPAQQEGIGKITPAGVVTEYSLGGFSGRAIEITTGPDGNLWFTQNIANRIGKITPAGAITYYSVGKPCIEPLSIAAGPDGNLWFVCHVAGHRIGRITTSGKVTYYGAGISGTPGDITSGPDGNVWFTEVNPNRIARLSLSGGSQLLPGVRVSATAVVSGHTVTIGTASNPPATRVTVAAKAGLATRQTVSVPTAKTAPLRLVLTHAAQRTIQTRGRLKVTVTVTARLASGKTQRATRSVTLRRH